jgi:hypothetical protein
LSNFCCRKYYKTLGAHVEENVGVKYLSKVHESANVTSFGSNHLQTDMREVYLSLQPCNSQHRMSGNHRDGIQYPHFIKLCF